MVNTSLGHRNHALTSLQPCTSATSLMVMAGRDGMRSSTQQRTEQRWESLPFPGPCATPESTPCCSWIIVLSSAPLGWCAQHTFSKSSWFLLMKSCLSSTQCESCLTKNIAQSAFQSATEESVCSNQPARAVFFPPSLPAQSKLVLVSDAHSCQQRFQEFWGQSCQDKLALVLSSLTIATFSSLNNPGPAFWGLRSDHTGKKK